GVEVADHLLVAAGGIGPDGGEFEAVERALAGQGLAAIPAADALLALGIFLADEDSEQRVVAELVMVVEVFVAEAQTEEALLEEFGQGVLDQLRVAVVGEAAGELLDEVELRFDLAEQQTARIGGDLPPVETGHDLTGSEGLEKQ